MKFKLKPGQWLVLILSLLVIIIVNTTDLKNQLTLDYLHQYFSELKSWVDSHYLQSIITYMALFTLLTAISFPATIIMVLLAGALFGSILGTIMICVAGSLGSCVSLLVSRYVARDLVQYLLKDKYHKIDSMIKKDGAFALMTLRMVPLMPFFIINLAVGLTSMRIKTFYLVTQFAMIPTTFVIVNAGQSFSRINKIQDLFSFQFLASFALIALVPLSLKLLWPKFKINS